MDDGEDRRVATRDENDHLHISSIGSSTSLVTENTIKSTIRYSTEMVIKMTRVFGNARPWIESSRLCDLLASLFYFCLGYLFAMTRFLFSWFVVRVVYYLDNYYKSGLAILKSF